MRKPRGEAPPRGITSLAGAYSRSSHLVWD